MSSNYTMIGVGLIMGGTTIAMVVWTPSTFILSCLMIGTGIAMFMYRGTQSVAKWGNDLLTGANKEPEFEFELKGGWDEDGKKRQ